MMQIPISEAAFMRQVTDLATTLGWEWMHIRPVGDSRGIWRTPSFGSLGQGWPDLVLIRRGTMIFTELKGQKGVLSREQRRIIGLLSEVCPHVYVWRPSDFSRIVEVLTNA